MDLERFWETKTEVNIDFGHLFFACFFRARFGIDFGWYFGGPKPEKYQFRLDGSTIFTKSTFLKKVRKNIDFGVVFGGHNDENSKKNEVENHVFF